MTDNKLSDSTEVESRLRDALIEARAALNRPGEEERRLRALRVIREALNAR